MTNNEPIEQWRKEFESGYSGEKDCFLRHPAFTHTYWSEKVQLHWEGYLMAKRSQPVIELPLINECEGILFVEDDYYHATEIHAALTAAGIKYTIGE